MISSCDNSSFMALLTWANFLTSLLQLNAKPRPPQQLFIIFIFLISNPSLIVSIVINYMYSHLIVPVSPAVCVSVVFRTWHHVSSQPTVCLAALWTVASYSPLLCISNREAQVIFERPEYTVKTQTNPLFHYHTIQTFGWVNFKEKERNNDARGLS